MIILLELAREDVKRLKSESTTLKVDYDTVFPNGHQTEEEFLENVYGTCDRYRTNQ